MSGGADRQSHCQAHVSVAGSTSELVAEPGDDIAVAGGFAPADAELGADACVATGVADEGAAGLLAPMAAAVAMFTCVTAPLSPGLSMRTLTFRLLGAVWTATGGRDVAAGGEIEPAAEAVLPVVSTEGPLVSGL